MDEMVFVVIGEMVAMVEMVDVVDMNEMVMVGILERDGEDGGCG